MVLSGKKTKNSQAALCYPSFLHSNGGDPAYKFLKNVSIYQVSPSFIVLFQKILSFTSIAALILLSYNKILGAIFVVVVLNDLLISIKLGSSRNLKKNFDI